MVLSGQVTVLLFAVLALACVGVSVSQEVAKGKVSCLDCPQQYDLSGIKVLVKCDKVKKMAMANTDKDGAFQVDLPQDAGQGSSPRKCDAKIYGGPNQIYAKNGDMISELIKSGDSNSYTVSTPLAFSTTSLNKDAVASSKTINLPVPPEWGLAPTSYYVPFIPIIGIP